MSDSSGPSAAPPKVAILGFGAIGTALAEGLTTPSARYELEVTTRSGASLRRCDLLGVRGHAIEQDPQANRRLASTADIVILAVKPEGIPDLIREIADCLPAGSALVSVAAGISLEVLRRLAPEGSGVFRSMPNLPVRVGKGMTGLATPAGTPERARARVNELFASVGETMWVDESKLDSIVALSGSGPAYVAYVLEQIQRQYEEAGAERDAARRASLAMLRDSCDANEQSGRGGGALTDEARRAAGVLKEGGFGAILEEAIEAARLRSIELGGTERR